jgi:hypothetical protein
MEVQIEILRKWTKSGALEKEGSQDDKTVSEAVETGKDEQ